MGAVHAFGKPGDHRHGPLNLIWREPFGAADRYRFLHELLGCAQAARRPYWGASSTGVSKLRALMGRLRRARRRRRHGFQPPLP
jgi:hypothetical protein